ncbi:site-specific DNA-methyltransferase [Candidatus Sulfurimonas baltica]|uniref:Methyltransferase n=2 Tax=Candidatus Sulfurimonas baltica TaxID=2740404 RepID=A0A7S7RPD8_9BACT|nr:site-specific DNA-methyltransferase [Candidatus Sulfurimonas baltica]
MDSLIADDTYIPLVVMDPPYLILNTKSGSKSNLSKSLQKSQDKLVKASITEGFDYEAVLDRLVKLQKGKINMYIWCNKAQIPTYFNYFIDGLGCSFDILKWVKTNPIPTFYNKYTTDTEYCLYFRKGGLCMPKNMEDASTLFLDATNAKDNKKYAHPTVKHLEHIERLIRNSSRENDLILDPFSGSGTTAVAALNLGRNFIGAELDKTFFDTSVSRIKNNPVNKPINNNSNLFAQDVA